MFKLATLFTLSLFGVATVSGAAIPRSPEPCDDDAASNVDVSTGGNITVTVLGTSNTTITGIVDGTGPLVLDINGTEVTPSDKTPPQGWLSNYLEVSI